MINPNYEPYEVGYQPDQVAINESPELLISENHRYIAEQNITERARDRKMWIITVIITAIVLMAFSVLMGYVYGYI